MLIDCIVNVIFMFVGYLLSDFDVSWCVFFCVGIVSVLFVIDSDDVGIMSIMDVIVKCRRCLF